MFFRYKKWQTTIIKNQNLSAEEKDKWRKTSWERYQNLTEEKIEKRHNKNLSEKKNQKLVE